MLTSTSGLESQSLSVLTDPSIILRSVYNKILPPASGIQHLTKTLSKHSYIGTEETQKKNPNQEESAARPRIKSRLS
jgi:hypothetical protein